MTLRNELELIEDLDKSESEIARLRAERDAMLPLLAAARAWWLAKQPLAYTAEQHLRNPEINCCGDYERALARAVAGLEVDDG